jgi:hypothetical protein
MAVLTMEPRTQPVATDSACFRDFDGQSICQRLPSVPTPGLHKGSIRGCASASNRLPSTSSAQDCVRLITAMNVCPCALAGPAGFDPGSLHSSAKPLPRRTKLEQQIPPDRRAATTRDDRLPRLQRLLARRRLPENGRARPGWRTLLPISSPSQRLSLTFLDNPLERNCPPRLGLGCAERDRPLTWLAESRIDMRNGNEEPARAGHGPGGARDPASGCNS